MKTSYNTSCFTAIKKNLHFVIKICFTLTFPFHLKIWENKFYNEKIVIIAKQPVFAILRVFFFS